MRGALSVIGEAGNEIEKGCIMERPKVIYKLKDEEICHVVSSELKGRVMAARAEWLSVTPAGPYRFVSSSRLF